MIQLIWGLLNLILSLFFLLTCFRALKLVREKWGIFSAIVFTFGLLSFCSRPSGQPLNKENIVNRWTFAPDSSIIKNTSQSTTLMLEKNLISNYNLELTYGTHKNSQTKVPVKAWAFTSGFVMGTQWRPEFVSVTPQKNGFHYLVNGIYEWKLLGVSLYSQVKTYKGFVAV